MEDLAGVFATAGRGAQRRASRLPLRAEQFIDSTGHCFQFAMKSNSRDGATVNCRRRRAGKLYKCLYKKHRLLISKQQGRSSLGGLRLRLRLLRPPLSARFGGIGLV